MASEWYYAEGGERQGPITFEQLQDLANSDKLQPTDLVWRKRMKDWQPTKTVEGLMFPAAAQKPLADGPGVEQGGANTKEREAPSWPYMVTGSIGAMIGVGFWLFVGGFWGTVFFGIIAGLAVAGVGHLRGSQPPLSIRAAAVGAMMLLFALVGLIGRESETKKSQEPSKGDTVSEDRQSTFFGTEDNEYDLPSIMAPPPRKLVWAGMTDSLP
jgi:hypothetical protein